MTNFLIPGFIDFTHGFIDSIKGLAFLRELDQDEEYEELASAAPPPRTVLQMRREKNGAVAKPPQKVVRHRERVWKRVIQCAGVNAAIIISLFCVASLLSFIFGFFTSSNYGALAGTLFCLPVFLITRILMALWFSDIAGACHRQMSLPDPKPMDFRFALAECLRSFILGIVFLAQGVLVEYIPLPVISNILMWFHMTLLNSMYSFEYFWSARTVSLQNRIFRLETRWTYFAGFGAPLTILCSLTSNMLVNGCVFAMLFPFFIISSYKAHWNRQYPDVEIPRIPIFTPSKHITNKLSILVSSYLLP